MDLQEVLAYLFGSAAILLLLGGIIFFGVRQARKPKAEGYAGRWDGTHNDYHYTDHS